MINATSLGSKPKELIPAGNYMARCYSMIHIGTIMEEVMGENVLRNKVRITWELPAELRVFSEGKGEQPMVISKEYTLSLHKKSNLRRDLESWRGKELTEDQAQNLDITKLLGVPCMLNIIHRVSKTNVEYAVISNITTIPKGFKCPEQVNKNFEWNFQDKFSEEVLESFPDFIKLKIKSSLEYQAIKSSIIDLTSDHDTDYSFDNESNDLPF